MFRKKIRDGNVNVPVPDSAPVSDTWLFKHKI